MTKIRLVIFGVLFAIAVVIIGLHMAGLLNPFSNKHSSLVFMIPILDVDNPQYDIQLLKPYLRPNDIVVFPIGLYNNVDPLKKQINGLNLATGGTSLKNLSSRISSIPTDIDYVTYDYERGHTPEWTSDQATSISYFDKLHLITTQNNKKLVIVPAWVFNPNFDWGEVAKHTDILVVQVQNFQTNAQGIPDVIKPTSLGIDLKGVTQLIVNQVHAKSPSTKIFLQFGFDVTNNPDDIAADVKTVKNLGIDGVTLWYNAGTSSNTSKVLLEKELLEKLEGQ